MFQRVPYNLWCPIFQGALISKVPYFLGAQYSGAPFSKVPYFLRCPIFRCPIFWCPIFWCPIFWCLTFPPPF